ncbi:MAG: hypothetical protein M1169_04875 [Firmicutes bacterium]|jgi:uncharacterized Zn finger protein|nr:hypothetical protein [Bacillota bacterium]
MPSTEKQEETRYCPTCGKKTIHLVTRIVLPMLSGEDSSGGGKGDIVKVECKTCGTVDNR